METLLVIDDERNICTSLARLFEPEGYHVAWVTEAREALPKFHEVHPHGVLLDLKMPELDGLQVLEALKASDAGVPVVIMTAYGTVKSAVDAMKKGAYDYILKPFSEDEIRLVVARALETHRLRREVGELKAKWSKQFELEARMGSSSAVQAVIRQVNAVAATDTTVLLMGESGTGKELVAQAIHERSARREKPFVPVDCAALPENLVEAELFGHEKGAYTGAVTSEIGKVEMADGGTLFFDEIGDLTAKLQPKLLRFLETRRFMRLGGRKQETANVRIVAATNAPLDKLVREKTFRADLFHRLNEFPILLPPLRHRKEDLAAIARGFLPDVASQCGKKRLEISADALKKLKSHAWPGNARELRNVLKRAGVTSAERIEAADIVLDGTGEMAEESSRSVRIQIEAGRPLKEITDTALRDVEREAIREAMEQSGGHRGKAAFLLGIDAKTLYNKLRGIG
ncbi:MAG: sigma-54-dependent Fis family transcriptional regulator [Nitrospirae bacterium]|nr:sigma-54-dependent Fis family transcriptional regulator [Nitrospirota bacterium]